MVSGDSEKIKSWERLFEAGLKVTAHNQAEDAKYYPLRKQFRPPAPNIAKASLKRDFEVGLVYYVGDDVEQDRALCGLDKKPPTAHVFKEALERKRKILEESGIMKELGFDKKKGLFKY
ncbi:MAG: hdrC-like protein [Candidatus Methanosuratus sp.]|nr:hdrC-like protein [Candidatus Methanosuratincola sp.]